MTFYVYNKWKHENWFIFIASNMKNVLYTQKTHIVTQNSNSAEKEVEEEGS